MPSHNGRPGGSAGPSNVTVVSTTDATSGTTTFTGHGGRGDHDGTSPPALAIVDLVTRVFNRFDTDGSGAIAVSELVAVLDPDVDDTELATDLAAKVARIDTDTDGNVGTAELTAALSALDTDNSGTLDASERPVTDDEFVGVVLKSHLHRDGHTHAPVSLSVSQAVEDVFVVFDTDSSQNVSLQELLATLRPRGHHDDAASLADALLALVDSDGDGSMSLAEVTAAVSALDTDQDGTIDIVPGGDADTALVGLLLQTEHDLSSGLG